MGADISEEPLSNSVETALSTPECVMVCVSAARSQGPLIAEGSRLARLLHAKCIVVHVSRSSETDADRQCLHSLAQQAEGSKAEFLCLVGDDVAATLLETVRMHNVTNLILGQGNQRWNLLWRRHLYERIACGNPRLGIVLVAVKSAPRGTKLIDWVGWTNFNTKAIVITTAACALTTAIAECFFRFFDASNLVALFMFTVVVVSLRFGRAAAIWAAFLSVASFDFFFIPPLLSFAMSDTQYLFTFALILVIALVVSEVGRKLHADARNARIGERREATVARVAQDLSGALKAEHIVAICEETIAPLLEAKIALILPDPSGSLLAVSAGGFEDLLIAQWSHDHVQRAGRGTNIFGVAEALYLPLKAPIRCRGVLAIRSEEQSLLEEPDNRRLLEACCSSIALALERMHFADVAQDTLVRMEGERLRNSLLSAVSHDLRTPLTAIRGLAETLERAADLPASGRIEMASAIRHQAEELQRMVTNLLDLARMQTAGVRLNRELHSLDEIVGSALSRLGPVLSRHHLRTDVPANLPMMYVDALMIERVLVNILDNALKYTPPGGKIVIGAKAVGDSMYCFVDDNGPGLPPGDSEQLFEPFVRGQKESAISGVGLGLALSRSIIGAHGGTIRAEAARPSGTRFEIRLPLGSPPDI